MSPNNKIFISKKPNEMVLTRGDQMRRCYRVEGAETHNTIYIKLSSFESLPHVLVLFHFVYTSKHLFSWYLRGGTLPFGHVKM